MSSLAPNRLLKSELGDSALSAGQEGCSCEARLARSPGRRDGRQPEPFSADQETPPARLSERIRIRS